MYRPILVPGKIGLVIAPVMGQIGADQDDVPGLETLDMIAHELGSATLVEIDQLHFRVIMPAVIDKGIPVFPDAEGMGRGLGDFE